MLKLILRCSFTIPMNLEAIGLFTGQLNICVIYLTQKFKYLNGEMEGLRDLRNNPITGMRVWLDEIMKYYVKMNMKN